MNGDELKAWEDKCIRCAKCCYLKIKISGVVGITRVPCENLNTDTNECTIYDDRDAFDQCSGSKFKEIYASHALVPNECPYVEGIKGYDGPKQTTVNKEQLNLLQGMFGGLKK